MKFVYAVIGDLYELFRVGSELVTVDRYERL